MKTYTTSSAMAYTADTEKSAEQFEEVATAYLGFSQSTGPLLKRLLTDAPDMPMAQCMLGYFQKLLGNAKMSSRAAQTFSTLAPLLDENQITEREKHYIAALGAWCEGDLDRAADVWERILVEHPTDALAIRLAHFLHFYSGDGRKMRDSVLRVLPRWSANHPHYGYVLGMGAFGHEESGEYPQAERMARDAVDLNAQDIWAVHALAHVFEMQQRHRDGVRWIDSLESAWSTANNFRFHVAWHRCLYQLELGDYGAILQTYDEELISDLESGFNLDLCNATSLLWRLELHGVDVGERWQRLAEISKPHAGDRDLIFISLHYWMALISTGDTSACSEMLDNIRQWAEDGSSQGKVCAECGLALAQALADFRLGRFGACAEALYAVRYAMDAIGGSKAQRDVFHMIMLDAYEKSGEDRVTRALLAERTAQRNRSAWGWHRYAKTLSAQGLEQEAQAAKATASALS